jgi:hypothetical protein
VTTLVPATLDHLVALFKAAATIGAATPPVEVIDGPMPNSGTLPLALWVGVKDIQAAAKGEDTLAADSEKTRVTASSVYGDGREEAITVYCVAAAWTGNEQDGYSALRAAAAGIVTAVETVVAADTGAPATSQNPGVTAGEWRQRPLNGLQVFVPFEIAYRAL